MMSGIAHLFMQTKENIARLREVKVSGFVDSTEISCVNNRAVQICALDVLLFEHRKKYGTQFNGLNGVHALHHKLLLKYQWPLTVIRDLNLSDLLLSLHDELSLDSFPEDVSSYLSSIVKTSYPVNFPDYLPGEWDPDLASKFLVELQR